MIVGSGIGVGVLVGRGVAVGCGVAVGRGVEVGCGVGAGGPGMNSKRLGVPFGLLLMTFAVALLMIQFSMVDDAL